MDQMGSYSCECTDGWMGATCDENIDECAANPCINGDCIDGINNYSCECNEGWMGATCDKNIDDCASSPCINGECIDGINNYTCNCYPLWGGVQCSVPFETKLKASDGGPRDFFGSSVAIDEDTLVIAAPTSIDDDGDRPARVYIFQRSPGMPWTEQSMLSHSEPNWFGMAVAISGDTLAVSSTNSLLLLGYFANGIVYIYTRSGSTWNLQQKLTSEDSGTHSVGYGGAIAISGDTLAVGAGYDDNGGSIYVYILTGTTWALQQKLTVSDRTSHTQFGCSLAIAGDTIVAGDHCFAFNADTLMSGNAYIFTRTGSTWMQKAKLTDSEAGEGGNLGPFVTIDEDTVVAGFFPNQSGDTGKVYIYTLIESTWTEQAQLTVGNPDTFFGLLEGVQISGDTIAVTERSNLDGYYFNESVSDIYLFTRRPDATWTEQATLVYSDVEPGDLFGLCLALSGKTLVVDNHGEGPGIMENAGIAYVYDLSQL